MPENSEVTDRLARRYPPPRIPRDFVRGLVIVAAVGFVAWVVWVGIIIATPAVVGRLNTFQIESDTQVSFAVTVERTDPSQTAVCRVIAQADNFERVGELSVEVAPGEAKRIEVAETMKTFRRATSVSIDSCRAG